MNQNKPPRKSSYNSPSNENPFKLENFQKQKDRIPQSPQLKPQQPNKFNVILDLVLPESSQLEKNDELQDYCINLKDSPNRKKKHNSMTLQPPDNVPKPRKISDYLDSQFQLQ